MSKKKKNGNKAELTKAILNLITELIKLITALIILIITMRTG